MTAKSLKIHLILCFSIALIQSYGQTGSTNRICLTPDQYRFFDEAVINAQYYKKENTRLQTAVDTMKAAAVKDSSAIAKLTKAKDIGLQKETVYNHDINKLQDEVDSSNNRVRRNRRIAIVSGVIAFFEGAIISGAVYLSVRKR